MCVCASLIGLSVLLAACQGMPAVEPTATAAPTATLVLPTATATVPPPRTLVVCLGQEPASLYLYGGSTRGMWSVLEAIYDGPIDRRQFNYQPVILEKLPTTTDGDATLQAVAVRAGDAVVNADGVLTKLASGTRVLPSGCSGPECAIAWDGTSELKVDQMTVKFKLRPGLKWSDGEALTAADSVYSFQVAADPATPVAKARIDYTASYTALDETTVQWVGQPGYITGRYATHFWLPLPKHAWGQMSPEQLRDSEDARLRPLGWGPYVIQEWVQGDHIRLTRNPNYFRAAEGLPHFDTLVYRFLGENGDNNLAALQAGECDVVDQTAMLDDQLEKVLDLKKADKLQALIGQGPETEIVDFGIRPRQYDDGYNAFGEDRPDFFGDGRVRKALALCMNRQEVVEKQLLLQSIVPASAIPPGHPLFSDQLKALPFDPAAGSALLDQAGWKDFDNSPDTPRVAAGVANVADGTPLKLSYVTTAAPLRKEVVRRLSLSLAQCGIGLDVQYVEPETLFAPGENGLLFGRNFTLAQFAWQSSDEPSCFLYESSQIPGPANHWLGVNITAYNNSAYDAACQAARRSLPGSESYTRNYQEAARILSEDFPVIPLYFHLKIAIARPDLCGLDMDVSARSELWSLETLDYGDQCPK